MLELPFAANGFELREAEPMARLVLRGRPAAVEAASFGVPLSPQPSRSVTGGNRATLHLGPDEWWLFAPEAELDAARADLTAALANTPHSLVDVSHRQIGLRLSGRHAVSVLAAFCPLDFDPGVFSEGGCTRTILNKADVMLWRVGPDDFHVEVARSFAGYVVALLTLEARSQAVAA